MTSSYKLNLMTHRYQYLTYKPQQW